MARRSEYSVGLISEVRVRSLRWVKMGVGGLWLWVRGGVGSGGGEGVKAKDWRERRMVRSSSRWEVVSGVVVVWWKGYVLRLRSLGILFRSFGVPLVPLKGGEVLWRSV